MSRALAYQDRHREAGLCVRCPLPAYLGGVHCLKHRNQVRDQSRARKGSKPWVKGRRGRPPLEAV